MPKVSITHKTDKDPKTVYDKVTSLLQNDPGLKKLDNSYVCEFDETTLSGKASGKMFKADMQIQESGGGSEVTIVVDLPMTLALAKGMVKSKLEGKLNDILS